MGLLIFLVVLIFVISLYVYFLVHDKLANKSSSKSLPYHLKNSIMTKSEMKFYKVLIDYVDNDSVILMKVSLKDFLYIGKGAGKEYMTHFNKISKKHVDFLICDKITLSPLYAIELDDPSHFRLDRIERDEFVDKVYETAGLQLIHIKTKKEYKAQDFWELKERSVATPQNQSTPDPVQK